MNKKKLTEEDLQWCQNALAKAEPYSEEEANSIPLDAEIYEFDFARLMAARAKKMLERGWKYEKCSC